MASRLAVAATLVVLVSSCNVMAATEHSDLVPQQHVNAYFKSLVDESGSPVEVLFISAALRGPLVSSGSHWPALSLYSSAGYFPFANSDWRSSSKTSSVLHYDTVYSADEALEQIREAAQMEGSSSSWRLLASLLSRQVSHLKSVHKSAVGTSRLLPFSYVVLPRAPNRLSFGESGDVRGRAPKAFVPGASAQQERIPVEFRHIPLEAFAAQTVRGSASRDAETALLDRPSRYSVQLNENEQPASNRRQQDRQQKAAELRALLLERVKQLPSVHEMLTAAKQLHTYGPNELAGMPSQLIKETDDATDSSLPTVLLEMDQDQTLGQTQDKTNKQDKDQDEDQDLEGALGDAEGDIKTSPVKPPVPHAESTRATVPSKDGANQSTAPNEDLVVNPEMTARLSSAYAEKRAKIHAAASASGRRWFLQYSEGIDNETLADIRNLFLENDVEGNMEELIQQLREDAERSIAQHRWSPKDYEGVESLIQVGSRIRSMDMERAGMHMIWETVVQPCINALVAMIPDMASMAMKVPVGMALTAVLGELLSPIVMELVVKSMMIPIIEGVSADLIQATSKPIQQALNPPLSEALKFATNSSVTRNVARGLTYALTERITVTLCQLLGALIAHGLTITMARQLASAVVPAVSMSLTQSLAKSIPRQRNDDVDCYWCGSSTEGAQGGEATDMFCERCYKESGKDTARTYFDEYYARYFSRYYTYQYGGYFADAQAHEYLDHVVDQHT